MEEHYKAIRKGIAQTEQSSLFSPPANKLLEEACAEFLKELGYSVRKSARPVFSSIKKVDDLISYFYDRIRKERGLDALYENPARDRTIAKKFIENRMETEGLNKTTAIQACAEIVKVVLDHYDDFNFKYEINFSIFGNDKLGWVTQRAIEILNSKHKVKREEDHKKKLDLMTKEAAKDTPLGFDDLDALFDQLEEDNNGSKKEDS